jgi:hypothetical protein
VQIEGEFLVTVIIIDIGVIVVGALAILVRRRWCEHSFGS